MLKVKEIKSNAIFPKDFLATLPIECSYCGGELEITETLTVLKCANPNCIEKGVQRMLELLKYLGVKNIGVLECMAFLNEFKTTNPYAILLYEPSEDGALYENCSMDYSYAMYTKLNTVREMFLWEYVKIGNFPGMDGIERILFRGFISIDGFYEDLYYGGVEFIQELLGLQVDNVVSVKAIAVYNTLMAYEHELRSGVEGVLLKNVGIPTLTISIATDVGIPFRSNSIFMRDMVAILDDKVHLTLLPSLTDDCDFLIWSKEGDATSKVNKAIKYSIPIYTGVEFEKYLRMRCLYKNENNCDCERRNDR